MKAGDKIHGRIEVVRALPEMLGAPVFGRCFVGSEAATGRDLWLMAVSDALVPTPTRRAEVSAAANQAARGTGPAVLDTVAVESDDLQVVVGHMPLRGGTAYALCPEFGASEAAAGDAVLLARAVARLHDRGLVHGALCLGSVARGDEGVFTWQHGIAGACEPSALAARARSLSSRQPFPPEFLAFGGRPTTATDVYAWAFTACQMISGRPDASAVADVAAGVGDLGPDHPLVHVLKSCLNDNAAARPRDAKELWDRLQREKLSPDPSQHRASTILAPMAPPPLPQKSGVFDMEAPPPPPSMFGSESDFDPGEEYDDLTEPVGGSGARRASSPGLAAPGVPTAAPRIGSVPPPVPQARPQGSPPQPQQMGNAPTMYGAPGSYPAQGPGSYPPQGPASYPPQGAGPFQGQHGPPGQYRGPLPPHGQRPGQYGGNPQESATQLDMLGDDFLSSLDQAVAKETGETLAYNPNVGPNKAAPGAQAPKPGIPEVGSPNTVDLEPGSSEVVLDDAIASLNPVAPAHDPGELAGGLAGGPGPGVPQEMELDESSMPLPAAAPVQHTGRQIAIPRNPGPHGLRPSILNWIMIVLPLGLLGLSLAHLGIKAGGFDVLAGLAPRGEDTDGADTDGAGEDDGGDYELPDIPTAAEQDLPPLVKKCPPGMANLSGEVCVDSGEFPGLGKLPMTRISYADAEAMCVERGARLCTIEEFRLGCGGEEGHRFPYGDFFKPYCNVSDGATRGRVSASGAKGRCRSPKRLYDAVGNVGEWVKGGFAVGGDVRTPGQTATCEARGKPPTGFKGEFVGFRCCMDRTE